MSSLREKIERGVGAAAHWTSVASDLLDATRRLVESLPVRQSASNGPRVEARRAALPASDKVRWRRVETDV